MRTKKKDAHWLEYQFLEAISYYRLGLKSRLPVTVQITGIQVSHFSVKPVNTKKTLSDKNWGWLIHAALKRGCYGGVIHPDLLGRYGYVQTLVCSCCIPLVSDEF